MGPTRMTWAKPIVAAMILSLTALGAKAQNWTPLDGDHINFRGEILRPDGSECLAVEGRAALEDAAALGDDLGRRLRARAPAGFFDGRP